MRDSVRCEVGSPVLSTGSRSHSFSLTDPVSGADLRSPGKSDASKLSGSTTHTHTLDSPSSGRPRSDTAQ